MKMMLMLMMITKMLVMIKVAWHGSIDADCSSKHGKDGMCLFLDNDDDDDCCPVMALAASGATDATATTPTFAFRPSPVPPAGLASFRSILTL